MERIGFIGLGIIGKPMVRNLLKAGNHVTVHNRSQAPVDNLAVEGATPASSPREVAEKSEVIITIVTDAPDVQQVLLVQNGVVEGLET